MLAVYDGFDWMDFSIELKLSKLAEVVSLLKFDSNLLFNILLVCFH